MQCHAIWRPERMLCTDMICAYCACMHLAYVHIICVCARVCVSVCCACVWYVYLYMYIYSILTHAKVLRWNCHPRLWLAVWGMDWQVSTYVNGNEICALVPKFHQKLSTFVNIFPVSSATILTCALIVPLLQTIETSSLVHIEPFYVYLSHSSHSFDLTVNSLCVCPSLSVCLSVYLSVYLSVCILH